MDLQTRLHPLPVNESEHLMGVFWDDDGPKTWVAMVGVWSAVALLAAVFLGGLAVLDNHTTHVDCLRLHEQTGLETRVARSGWNEECYVRTSGGHWVPEDRYRGVDGDSNG
jgi:hypothetical protein